MKKVLLFAFALVAGFTVMAQQATTDQLVKFNAETYNFGKIKQGVPVTTFFEIKNISKQPIVIESATAGCGCTTPEWSKEPVAPGATAKIKVGYNSAAMGAFTKPVTVKLAGTADAKQIMISGDVIDAAAYEAYLKSDEFKTYQASQVKATTTTDKTKTKTTTKTKTSGK